MHVNQLRFCIYQNMLCFVVQNRQHDMRRSHHDTVASRFIAFTMYGGHILCRTRRKRQKCLEAAADFLLAGGQLSAKPPVSTNGHGGCCGSPNIFYTDLLVNCRGRDDNPCSAAAVLLRRGLGGRAVSDRQRKAAGNSPLRSFRRQEFRSPKSTMSRHNIASQGKAILVVLAE